VNVTEADREEARSVVMKEDDRTLVALNPGASDPQRRWPPANFAAVGDALAVTGARVLITGAAEDAPLAAAIRQAMRCPAEDLTGRLSLGGLAGLLERCELVASNDTGPLHLAAAVGTATVGIYWCVNMINAGPVTTARQRPLVSWQRTCAVCGVDRIRERCDHQQSFVAEVPTDEVIEVALDLYRSETGSCSLG
jgi:ADP-heptose:LPS heptosyltransferase